MSDYLSKLVTTAPLRPPTGRTIRLSPNPLAGLKAQNIWIDDTTEKGMVSRDELPAWLQVTRDRLQDDKNKLANVVIKLAEDFSAEDWRLNRYNNNGVELYHKATGVGIDVGSVSATVRLTNLNAVNFNIKMGGNGKQLNPLVAAINYLTINVVNSRLDKALALGEQGEFKLEEAQKQTEVDTFEAEVERFHSQFKQQAILYNANQTQPDAF